MTSAERRVMRRMLRLKKRIADAVIAKLASWCSEPQHGTTAHPILNDDKLLSLAVKERYGEKETQ
jgi:hypothetical protein